VLRAARHGAAGVSRSAGPAPEEPRSNADDGWRIFGSMIAGMALYGGIGWLIDHWTGISILFPLGMLFGVVVSVIGIIVRFSRS